jgi:hypothetical protein
MVANEVRGKKKGESLGFLEEGRSLGVLEMPMLELRWLQK